jgi:molecular chaperone HtpG
MDKENIEFKAEVRKILDLMIHSLYSHKEIFLRELISNASDAIDKARYESLTDSGIMEDESEFRIRISVDRDAGTLTVSDNGIGMSREEAVEELGTIAHSGTREFIEALQSREVKENPEMIGQFGVGFYSSFMVADKVSVTSRKAGRKDGGLRWESSAEGSFSVEDVEKKGKGTDVTLHLKEDEKKYMDQWEIRNIVGKYSDFIEHPIVMDVEKEKEEDGKKIKTTEEETLNSRKAIWTRRKSEVSDEEYAEFYKHISHDYSEPASIIHYRAEGTSEFSALLYIPSKSPFGILYRDFKTGPALYIKRVLIKANCEELLPPYLRFVRGVVDSSDLPLNISRETLQNNRQIETIKKNIVKKILEALRNMKDNEYDKYVGFHSELGRVLKEGIHMDFERKETIADLLLLESTSTEPGEFTTLQKYIDAMKIGQEDIYYITSASREEAVKSPYLEAFMDKGYEVLILTDDIDDIIMSGLIEFNGKKLKSAVKGDLQLEGKGEEKEKAGDRYGKLLELIKDILKDRVGDVRFSGRLKDSACCLVADEGGLDMGTEELLKAMGQDVPASKKILELNAGHPLIEAMGGIFEKDAENPVLKDYTGLLYNQALLLVGSKPEDPAAFTASLTSLMLDNARRNDA